MRFGRKKMVLALAMLLPVLVASAAGIIIINNRVLLEAMAVGSLNVQDSFIIVVDGHDVTPVDVAAAGTSRADAVMIGPMDAAGMFPVASNGASAGDWVLGFTIQTTDRTPELTSFQFTLRYNMVNPITGAVGSRTIVLYGSTGDLTPGVAEGIIIVNSLGPELATPSSFVLTVQKL